MILRFKWAQVLVAALCTLVALRCVATLLPRPGPAPPPAPSAAELAALRSAAADAHAAQLQTRQRLHHGFVTRFPPPNYTVSAGDSAASISAATGVPPSMLAGWNGAAYASSRGARLRLREPSDRRAAQATARRVGALRCTAVERRAPLAVVGLRTLTREPQPVPAGFPRLTYTIGLGKGAPILSPGGAQLPRWLPRADISVRKVQRPQQQQNRDVSVMLQDLVDQRCYGHCELLLLEDDFRWCPGATAELRRVHSWALRNARRWEAIRVGFGFSGLMLKCALMPELLQEVRVHVDEPGVDWIATVFYAQHTLTYRYNLFQHMSKHTTIGWSEDELADRNSQLAGCYQYLSGTGLHALDYFDIDQCDDRLLSPCADAATPYVRDAPPNAARDRIARGLKQQLARSQSILHDKHVGLVIGELGASCDEACGPACLPQMFGAANQCEAMRKVFPSCKCEVSYGFERFSQARQAMPLFSDIRKEKIFHQVDYPKPVATRCLMSKDPRASFSTCAGEPAMRLHAGPMEQGRRLCVCNVTRVREFKQLQSLLSAIMSQRQSNMKLKVCFSAARTDVQLEGCHSGAESLNVYGSGRKRVTLESCALRQKAISKSEPGQRVTMAELMQRQTRSCRGFAKFVAARKECSERKACMGVVRTGWAKLPFELRYGQAMAVEPRLKHFYVVYPKLPGCGSGYASLEKAKVWCRLNPSCSGVAKDARGEWQLRSGDALLALKRGKTGRATHVVVPCESADASPSAFKSDDAAASRAGACATRRPHRRLPHQWRQARRAELQLFLAARTGHLRNLKQLLKRGVSPNAVRDVGETD